MNISIYSVATVMQDILWGCSERIIPKKVWRTINYETCTLSHLSKFISKPSQELLRDILDFLVKVMRHKHNNWMNAYHLGEAMGKSVLAPSDCDVIMAEKAGHFLMRMIIDHARCRTMSKAEATRAKAKSYDRIIRHIKRRRADWLDNSAGLRNMLDNDYDDPLEQLSDPAEKPWISIFSQDLTRQCDQAAVHPVLLGILVKISTNQEKDTAGWSDPQRTLRFRDAFSEFKPAWHPEEEVKEVQVVAATNNHPLRRINRSFSNLRLNLRKIRSQQNLCDSDGESTINGLQDYPRTPSVKTMMRKVMRSMRK
ncbi:hypothetical protein DFQ28_008266 [Apophysomyces sp. BC1034]|nr:hypothetical protein DFQ30_007974 [Apophysomyces sp. BC1015]KAG0186137.1 hypothetical protein DFQ28_008266 [Apophysomyces sp. BC1034]